MTASPGISDHLLQQELSRAEVQALLQRRGCAENPKRLRCLLADIIGVTGAEPRTAAAALAAIRQEAWEEKFGVRRELVEERQGDHSRLIARPSAILAAHERKLVLPRSSQPDPALLARIEQINYQTAIWFRNVMYVLLIASLLYIVSGGPHR